ncbi:translation initiation factor SU [Hyaloscypha variabilis F]|uniref:Translation initiation factor SU n=1 Tax=Hyaloscypha variabilis (strain UAMH 11265 / GT02V1 / F) TaxID=1149755 RepID=A0A2J6S6L1_HYAVF|nr:translation initiation factor SU [Hyaloscypha variabilis F]
MSTKKDMRRPDLIIPYQLPTAKEAASDISGTLGSTLPMAAMFTRNKFIGWASVVLSVQNWLGESAEAKKSSSQPAYFSVGMAFMALAVTYLPMFLPPPSVPGQGTGTEAPAAAPPSLSSTNNSTPPPNTQSSDTATTFRALHPTSIPTTPAPRDPGTLEFMSIENLKTFDPFAEADEDTGETKQSQNYIHIRIQQRNGRKTLTTVQGLPKKFDQKKILKVIKKKFACNGTIVVDSEMGEVIQLQGDQRKDVQEFLTDKKEGLELDAKTIKVHGF